VVADEVMGGELNHKMMEAESTVSLILQEITLKKIYYHMV